MKLSEITEKVGGSLEGDGDIEIRGLAGLAEAGPGEISFLSNPRYATAVASTKASAVIVSNDWKGDCPCAMVRVDVPDAAFAKAGELLAPPPIEYGTGIHPTAVIAEDASLGENVYIGPYCVIEPGAVIGDNCILVAGVYVGHNVKIGSNVRLYPYVSIREECIIGERVIIHNGAVIGSDGFGFVPDEDGVYHKIRQAGIVVISDDVEIGANTALDRARFGRTVIGKGTKIDNLVQIAHNVRIGEHTVMAALTGISGSSQIGSHVQVAGQVGMSGHLKVGDGAILGAQSGISKNVDPGKFMFGSPAMEYTRYAKQQAQISSIPRLKKKLAELEQELRELKENQ